MKKIFKLCTIILTVLILTGCTSSIKEISYKDLEKKLKNKETFILEIVQDGCSNCEEFTPKFDKVLNKYKLKSLQINLTNLTEEDNTKLQNMFNTTGTPTVIFINKGEEQEILTRIVGNVNNDKIISKLKNAGYIK